MCFDFDAHYPFLEWERCSTLLQRHQQSLTKPTGGRTNEKCHKMNLTQLFFNVFHLLVAKAACITLTNYISWRSSITTAGNSHFKPDSKCFQLSKLWLITAPPDAKLLCEVPLVLPHRICSWQTIALRIVLKWTTKMIQVYQKMP